MLNTKNTCFTVSHCCWVMLKSVHMRNKVSLALV